MELVCILSLSVSLSNCILRKPKWNDNLKIYTTKNLEGNFVLYLQLVIYLNEVFLVISWLNDKMF